MPRKQALPSPKQLNKSGAVSSLIAMAKLSADQIWNATEQELTDLLNSETLVPQPKKIRFYAPSFTYYKTAAFCSSSTKDFPTISVTGNGCALNCKHCGGKVLETMHPADSPEKLLALCTKLKQEGAKGVLVSGGCLPDGSVPLQKFMAALASVKRDLGLTVFVHTGIVDAETAVALKAAGVDAALIDVIGSDETIREIYNLNTTAKQYENSLKALSAAGIDFVPHVIVGLHHGELKGELHALKMIKPYKPSAIVVISFMPIHGTADGENQAANTTRHRQNSSNRTRHVPKYASCAWLHAPQRQTPRRNRRVGAESWRGRHSVSQRRSHQLRTNPRLRSGVFVVLLRPNL